MTISAVIFSYLASKELPKDDAGKHKTKWISTGLPVKGNKRSAEEMLLDARMNFDMPSARSGDSVTFAGFMSDWLEMIRANVELTTYASYRFYVKSVICPYFEEKRILLHDLQPKHLQDFYSHCMNVRNVTASTVIHYHADIHKALKYAVDTDILPTNPADKVQRPKHHKYVGQFYCIGEVNSKLNLANSMRASGMNLFAGDESVESSRQPPLRTAVRSLVPVGQHHSYPT